MKLTRVQHYNEKLLNKSFCESLERVGPQSDFRARVEFSKCLKYLVRRVFILELGVWRSSISTGDRKNDGFEVKEEVLLSKQ